MPNENFVIRVEGADYDVLATELADLINTEFGLALHPIPPQEKLNDKFESKADLCSVAALILSIPGAVLAAIQVADRIEKNKRIQRIIEWAKSKCLQDPKRKINLTLPEGKVVSLEDTSSAEILEEAGKSNRD